MLDKKDKRILAELMVNSRLPITQLARKVGVRREVVLYRINRLVNQGIIKNFYAVINSSALGFLRYTFFVQLKNVNKEKEAEILDFFINHKAITYVGPLIGRWNFAFDMLAKNKKQLNEMIEEILLKLSRHIKKYTVIETTAEEEFYPEKLIGAKSNFKVRAAIQKTAKLNPEDKKILRLLANDSRINYVELGKRVKLSANAIRYKIRELEKKGIIIKYAILLDFRKLNYHYYNLQIKITDFEIENKLRLFLRENKRTQYFYRYLGNENWDLDLGVIVEDEMQLRDFLIELRDLFGGSIEFNDIYIVLEEIKPYLPEIVFEDELA